MPGLSQPRTHARTHTYIHTYVHAGRRERERAGAAAENKSGPWTAERGVAGRTRLFWHSHLAPGADCQCCTKQSTLVECGDQWSQPVPALHGSMALRQWRVFSRSPPKVAGMHEEGKEKPLLSACRPPTEARCARACACPVWRPRGRTLPIQSLPLFFLGNKKTHSRAGERERE